MRLNISGSSRLGLLESSDRWAVALIVLFHFIFCAIHAQRVTRADKVHDNLKPLVFALQSENPLLLSRDYLFQDSAIAAIYPPLHMSILRLGAKFFANGYLLLVFVNLLYGLTFGLGCFWILRRIGLTTWFALFFHFILGGYFTQPLNEGVRTGIYRVFYALPVVSFEPSAYLLVQILLLPILYCLVFRAKDKSCFLLSLFSLGLVCSVHPSYGIGFLVLFSPLVFKNYFEFPHNQRPPLRKMLLSLLAGTSIMIGIYAYFFIFRRAPSVGPYDPSLLYQFALARHEDSFFPFPFYKLLIKHFSTGQWICYGLLILTSLMAVAGSFSRNTNFALIVITMIGFYLYFWKWIPFAAILWWVRYTSPQIGAVAEQRVQSILAYAAGLLLASVLLQIPVDVYSHLTKTPPVLIAIVPRFINLLYPAAVLLIVSLVFTEQPKLSSRGLVALGLLLYFQVYYQSTDPISAKIGHQSTKLYSNTIEEFLDFRVPEGDYQKLVAFAKQTPAQSLFVFLSDDESHWLFRFDSWRATAINFSDMIYYYYRNKSRLAHDLGTFHDLSSAYKTRDVNTALRLARELKADYLIFPRMTALPKPIHVALEADHFQILAVN